MPFETPYPAPGSGAESTIVAVATPSGVGGLAAVRLSGPQAHAIAAQVFGGVASAGDFEERRAVYGILTSQNTSGQPVDEIDQVVALPYRAPRSFTGEDVVEFFCHGGNVIARRIVEACLAVGAEPAAAGEFTRRAFLNGKLSLDQAEAVADLIHAETRLSARTAVRQLLGGLDRQLAEIEVPLLGLLAELEGSLEFSEDEYSGDESTEPDPATTLARLATAAEAIDELRRIGRAGRLLRDGIQVVLVGAPNVGKSSLLNALVEDDRAIVDEEPGTTRDVVSARCVRDGKVFVFHDTAGLREQAGAVEKKGIERTGRMLGQADVVLHLVETSELAAGGPGELPESAARILAGTGGDEPAALIRIGTKTDLVDAPRAPGDALLTSSRAGTGLDELWRRLEQTVAAHELQEAADLGVLLNDRHVRKLDACRTEIEQLRETLRAERPGAEVVATLLASITAHLGEISGRVFSEQVLGEIFRRFCVGK